MPTENRIKRPILNLGHNCTAFALHRYFEAVQCNSEAITMPSQTKQWQTSILDAAKRKNDLSRLYWFIEMRIPPQSRAKRFAEGYCPAAWPEAHVPVIPVGNEPESSRAVADFLAAMVRCNNPRIMEAAPALCDAESLATAGCAWYIYGEAEFDAICYACGAVGKVIHYAAGDGWLCATCSAEHEP